MAIFVLKANPEVSQDLFQTTWSKLKAIWELRKPGKDKNFLSFFFFAIIWSKGEKISGEVKFHCWMVRCQRIYLSVNRSWGEVAGSGCEKDEGDRGSGVRIDPSHFSC